MGLMLYYKENDQYLLISQNSIGGLPVSTTHDGKTGDIHSRQLFIRNDDVDLWFSNIQVIPYDKTATDIKDDTDYISTGWGVKLASTEDEPTTSAWLDIDWADAIMMDDIGSIGSYDVTTYFPFWYQITCPPNIDAQTKSNISIRVAYTENAV